MVVNIVDVGWATSKSGCLPISGWDILKTTRLPVDKDRGERDMAEDAPENWLPEMEAARKKEDCRVKVDPQNKSRSQEGNPNPA